MQPLSERRRDTAELAIVLIDSSLQLVASNRQAAAILLNGDSSEVHRQLFSRVLQEALAPVLSRNIDDLAPLVTRLRWGNLDYSCRAYLMHSHNGRGAEAMMALLLERDCLDNDDALSEGAARFNLTERELQTLRWMSQGLTTKEIAQRMKISPNTVRCFVRLITGKMGVTTRTAMVAKVLSKNNRESSGAGMR